MLAEGRLSPNDLPARATALTLHSVIYPTSRINDDQLFALPPEFTPQNLEEVVASLFRLPKPIVCEARLRDSVIIIDWQPLPLADGTAETEGYYPLPLAEGRTKTETGELAGLLVGPIAPGDEHRLVLLHAGAERLFVSSYDLKRWRRQYVLPNIEMGLYEDPVASAQGALAVVKVGRGEPLEFRNPPAGGS